MIILPSRQRSVNSESIWFSYYFTLKVLNHQKFLNPQKFFNLENFVDPRKFLKSQKCFTLKTLRASQKLLEENITQRTKNFLWYLFRKHIWIFSAKIFFVVKSTEWKLKILNILFSDFSIFRINSMIRVSVKSNACEDFEGSKALCPLINPLVPSEVKSSRFPNVHAWTFFAFFDKNEGVPLNEFSQWNYQNQRH